MKIGLDVDGVIYDWHSLAYEYATEHMGATESFENIWGVMWDKYGETWCMNLIKTLHLYDKVNVDKYILETLKDLSKSNILYYITHVEDEIKFVRRKWFNRNRIPFRENLIFSNSDKSYYARILELDYFVDDRPKYLIPMRNLTNCILVKKPWNKDYRDQFTCIDSIIELPEIVK